MSLFVGRRDFTQRAGQVSSLVGLHAAVDEGRSVVRVDP